MPLTGEYEPSPWEPIAEQVRQYEATGGKEGGTLEGAPCVILTTKGRKPGKLRKSPLMRIEHDGVYAVVASLGGADHHPVWYLNLVANPEVTLQDGDRVFDFTARTASDAREATLVATPHRRVAPLRQVPVVDRARHPGRAPRGPGSRRLTEPFGEEREDAVERFARGVTGLVDEVLGEHRVGGARDAVRVALRRVDLDRDERVAELAPQRVEAGRRHRDVVGEAQTHEARARRRARSLTRARSASLIPTDRRPRRA